MIAQNLIKLRKKNNLTQKELSIKLNYSDKVISKWERGESTPNVEALQALSKFYKISIDEIVNDEPFTKDNETPSYSGNLEVIQTEKPSFISTFWILLPFVIQIYLIWQGPTVFFPGLFVFSILLIIWSLGQSKVSFEAKYKGNTIIVRNRMRKCELLLNDQIVDGLYGLIVITPKLSCKIGEDTVKIKIDNWLAVKCYMFVN